MDDLPELPDRIKRKLALQWSALLDAHHFTGEQFRLHDAARARRARQWDRRRRIAALPGASGGLSIDESAADQETVVDDAGIGPSVALAESRFNDLSAEYWSLWWSSANGHEVFAGWLDTIKQQVSTEFASAWKGGSVFIDRWYQRACGPAVENALAALVKDWTTRARADEMKRLELGEKPGSVSNLPKDANTGTVAEQRRGAAAAASFRPQPSESTTTGRKRRGPSPDYAAASRVAGVVYRIVPDVEWGSKWEEICEALDKEEIPCPKTWRHRNPPWRLWSDCTERSICVKAIERRLQKVAQ